MKIKINFLTIIAAICLTNGISCAKISENMISNIDINQICLGIFFEARPFPNDNKYYVGCIRERGAVFQCFENEIFDGEALRCVENSETPSTIPIDTSSLPQITTEDPMLNGICDSLFFDFIEHPTDCGLLIFCYEQMPIIRECPQDFIFDIETEQCQSGNRETCKLDKTTTTTEANIDGVCDGFVFHFVPHPTDCGLAIFCFEEMPIVRECPKGEIFDTRIDNCRPGDRDTCIFSSSISVLNYCEGRDEDALIAHAIDSRKFYLCAVGKNAILLQCEDNKVFDGEKSLCMSR